MISREGITQICDNKFTAFRRLYTEWRGSQKSRNGLRRTIRKERESDF